MKNIYLLLVFFTLTLNAQNRKSKLQKDFDYLITELKSQHQGLYEYLPEKQVNSELENLRNSITDTMSTLDFYLLARKVIGLTNEGHTSVSLPKWTKIKTGLSKSFLPLAVKFCGKELVVSQNYGKAINGIEKGTIIKAINGKRIQAITAELIKFIPTDGFNQTSKYEWIGGVHFALLYRLVYGKSKLYKLTVENNNIEQTVDISAIRYTHYKSKNAILKKIKIESSTFSFRQINDSIAYLSIPSFGKKSSFYPKFYKETFQKIKNLNIKHLIIDMQDNGGGTEGVENLLVSYLIPKRFKKYKKVTALPKSYDEIKDNKSEIRDQWKFNGVIAERGDFTLYSDYYSELDYKKPSKHLIYTNKLYVLISGYTFSGGSEFANMIKMQDRGVFIGEETGGAYDGNVSGYSTSIKLPNTRIRVSIPIIHYQMNVDPIQKGQGVKPNCVVPQTRTSYLNNTNNALDFALNLILK